MEGLAIVISLFVCTPDALYCENLSPTRTFDDPARCAEAAETLADAQRSRIDDQRLVMAKCRYVLDGGTGTGQASRLRVTRQGWF